MWQLILSFLTGLGERGAVGEEEKKEPELKEQNEVAQPPDNLGSGVMTPDLGAVANALSDEMPEDERSV